MKRNLAFVLLIVLQVVGSNFFALGQTKPDKELKMPLNESGSHYLKTTFTGQVWARYNQSNPGTTVYGYDKDETFDIGLRRVRSQIFGQVSDKVFFYSQIGINNYNYMSARKPGIFVHDLVIEYQLKPRSLSLGAGLSSWNGLSRFSSIAVASILGLDAPLYQQTTNDVTDQFFRKFSIYGKGKLGKLDYRVIVTTPMATQNAGANIVKSINTNSDFSLKPAKLQHSAYFMYQFLYEERNLTPFTTGSYLGKKRVFNIGAGYQFQPSAMWHYNDTAVASRKIVEENLFNYNIDAFYDAPVGSKGAAITAYLAYTHLGFGKNYIRDLGVMNPADFANTTCLNGGGNGIPLYGTGNVIYFQSGYLLPPNLLGQNNGQLQPYIMIQHSNYERLKDPMEVYNVGMNYFIDDNRAKISLDLQNRPIFDFNGSNIGRRNAVVLQLQVAI